MIGSSSPHFFKQRKSVSTTATVPSPNKNVPLPAVFDHVSPKI